MVKWTTADIPSQLGKTIVVTGVGGLGFETAKALANAGARVILAGRNAVRGAEGLAKIKAASPSAQADFEIIDLANLASIREFGARLSKRFTRVDTLINNAGVMMPPQRKETSDGFELQLGTNHLGHFALTAAVLPLLREAADARVVHVSSIAARSGSIDFDDLQWQRSYNPPGAYNRSKLANLLFGFELMRRSEAANWGVSSIVAHPGVAKTEIVANGPGRKSGLGLAIALGSFLLQSAAQGALPTLFAATSPNAKGGAYYGPDKLSEVRGYPTLAKVPPRALDTQVARRLWEVSSQLTGAKWGP